MRQLFEVGCDVVEINTFNSSPMDMAEYDMLDRVRSLNAAAAKPARSVADDFSARTGGGSWPAR
jgi:5-methyltetrahydrofolate--homocysteine methyltransferase